MQDVKVHDAAEVLACECGQEFPIGRLAAAPALYDQIRTVWTEHHQGPHCAPTDAAGAAIARAHREALLEDVIRQLDLAAAAVRDARMVMGS